MLISQWTADCQSDSSDFIYKMGVGVYGVGPNVFLRLFCDLFRIRKIPTPDILHLYLKKYDPYLFLFPYDQEKLFCITEVRVSAGISFSWLFSVYFKIQSSLVTFCISLYVKITLGQLSVMGKLLTRSVPQFPHL